MASTVRTIASAGAAAGLIAATALVLWTDGAASSKPPGVLEAPRITVEAGASRVVCPSGLKLPGTDSGEQVSYDPQFDPAPEAVTSQLSAIVEGAFGGEVAPLGDGNSTLLPGPLAVWTGEVGTAPLVATARAVTGFSPLTGGGALIQSVGGDLGGFAGASCLSPRAESYIVGGDTQVGSATRLVMVNPGATSATVDLTLWGPSGRVDAVGGTGLILPPGSQRVALLEGMIGGAGRLAVKVSASGGEVAAYLQHSRLDGLVPAGVDFAVPGAPPDTEVVVPGIVALATTVESPDPTRLRLLVTGRQDAAVSVTVHGPEGPVEVPGIAELTLVAGEVTDLPLLGLPEGAYTATVSSDRPLVAAAMSTRFSADPSAPREIAWSASGLVPEQGFLAVFPRTTAFVAGGPGASEIRYQSVGPDGELGVEEVIALPGGTTQVIDTAGLAASGAIGIVFNTDAEAAGALAAVDLSEDGTAISVRVPTDASAMARSYPVEPAGP